MSVRSGRKQIHWSDSPSISADGRYVAFASNADNLIANDANGPTSDIFVKDLATGEVTLANWPGVSANAGSYQPALSGNGRFVAFESDATNLVDGDVNGVRDIFVRNLDLGRITAANQAGQHPGDAGQRHCL